MHLRNELYGVILTAFKKIEMLIYGGLLRSKMVWVYLFLIDFSKRVVSNVIFSLLVKEIK